ncbi:MAG TPA: carboxyl transferase domain-containing protein [Candidatus Binatia bacterium]|nr:carboxyl transferase domain-containing protein [Candidatus Binatia bacterium]
MSWQKEVEGIEQRRQRAREHGGREAVAHQRAQGRLTIRERIAGLIDAGSFREQGPIAGHSQTDEHGELQAFTPANYVLGVAKIDGRPCVVGGEDFTLRGGSPTPAGLRKSVFAEELACRYRMPLIRFLEGGGGSVPRGSGKGEHSGGEAVNAPPRFMSIMQVMGLVPVASAAVGPVAGLPAARLVASHFSIMTKDTAQVMIGGPALVERAFGRAISKEELGGAQIHLHSGVVDNVADDEAGVFAHIRRFLSYLPTNIWEAAPVLPGDDDRNRQEAELLEIVPRNRRRIYNMRRVIDCVVDRGSFFELAPLYGQSQITGLARLNGQPVGILANDPAWYAGAMTAAGAQKVRRLVDLCDTFHLPVVSLVDEPGFMIGPEAEQAATIRYGTATLFAVMQSTVPWVSVIVRKVYGVAGAAHFGPGGMVFAWPSAESGALPLEGGVAVAYRREIAAAPDPEARRRELEEQIASQRSPYARAEAFGVHDLIDPRHTRPVLCDWIDWIQPQLQSHRGPRAYTIRP